MNKKAIFIFLFLFLSFKFCLAQDFGDAVINRMYKQLLKATFPSDKGKIAISMVDYNQTLAKKALLVLIKDDHYWNRLGAVEGLAVLKDSDCDRILVRLFFDDHMINTQIGNAFKKDMERFFSLLLKEYNNSYDEEKQEKIIKFLALSQYGPVQDFLKEKFEDPGLKFRAFIFKKLLENFPSGNDQYFRKYIDDKSVRNLVLAYIIKQGRRDDYPIFLRILENPEKEEHILIAYEAVNKWGNYTEKVKVFLGALQSGNETLIQGACYVFQYVRSPEIKKTLVGIVKNARYQESRLLAAEQLIGYVDRDVLPALILVLKENYQGRDYSSGADIFASVVTLGISSIFNKVDRQRSKKAFASRKKNILNVLVARTGENFGYDFSKWKQWVVLQGEIVEGENLLQYLFSAYPQLRERARNQAIYLLKYRNPRDFFKQYPQLADLSDLELALFIAEKLIQKRIFTDLSISNK